MTPEPSESLVPRHRRAVALITLALLAIGATSFAYLRPTLRSQTRGPASTVASLEVTSFPVEYAFVTPSIGWASVLVSGPSAEAGRFRVFRTIDGAKHWQQQLALQSSRAYDARSDAQIRVQMFGKTLGFMAIGWPIELLYRTTDGGAHWDPLVLPLPSFNAVTFSDATHGWLDASYVSRDQGPYPLYATSDAGHSWKRLPDPPADAAVLGFRGPSEAWMGSVAGPGPPHVYISSDAGQRWQRHELPAPAGGWWVPDRYFPGFPTWVQLLPGVGAMAQVEVSRCVDPPASLGTASCPNAASESSLFTSRDGGNTWSQVPPPPGFVTYQDSVHWWATTRNTLFKSTDSGQSWQQAATISPDWEFGTPGILDSTHAWASLVIMGGTGLALTNDGGLHWTLANVPQPA